MYYPPETPPRQITSSYGSFDERYSHTPVSAMAAASSGEYFVSGSTSALRMWQADGNKVATMTMGNVAINCLAISKDGRMIAAGTFHGELWVWNAKTHKQVYVTSDRSHMHGIDGVDFSPDSTRLLVAWSRTDWQVDIYRVSTDARPTRDIELRNPRNEKKIAVKYSPRGDQIATATPSSVQIHDGNDGRLLLDVPVPVTPWYNTGLVWFKEDLVIVSGNKIKQISASTGSTVSEWSVADANRYSCIAMPQNGEFIAYSTERTVTFLDLSGHTRLGHIQYTQDVRSIALSPDGRFVAIGGDGGKITIKPLSGIAEPDIQIDDAVLRSWKLDELSNAEALLTAGISKSQNSTHHVLAGRALVRGRLRRWDAAIDDADQSIDIKPSMIAYVAKSMALVGKGERQKGYRALDIAFDHAHATHVRFLLLIKAIVTFSAGEHDDAMSRLDDLIAIVPFSSACHTVKAYMYLLLGDSHMNSNDHPGALHSFERAQAQIEQHSSIPPLAISLISGWKFDGLCVTIQQRLCEALFAAGRTINAAEGLLKMVAALDEEVYRSESMTRWVSDFACRCLIKPENGGGSATHAMFNSGLLTPLVTEWVKATLAHGSWKDALLVATDFRTTKPILYRAMCRRLLKLDRIVEATECFHEMERDWGRATEGNIAQWSSDFRSRSLGMLESLGDAAMDASKYDEAISNYSAALSLSPPAPQVLFVKRSKARSARGSWQGALDDANEVIILDPSSPLGYESKCAALRVAGRHEEMLEIFKIMLLMMSQSHDPVMCERYHQYGKTKETIQRAVRDAVHESPRVLINIASGRLCNKFEQAAAFEQLPIFTELVSTIPVDRARVEREVKAYYRYATFSHKWEINEPLFDEVLNVVVYDLDGFPTRDKLKMFCKIVRDAGFHWAWSDTCCINKADHFVLQEALVAMFKWYRGSALTVIFLRGVGSLARRGALARSMWNTRAWTFQEYHASTVVRFYTEDWTPYLSLDTLNHKDSPEIISEMEETTGVSARVLMGLRPGLNDIREKLCLASQRETTLVEDAAYSLLGIFSVTLPVMYGEGERSVGRLLAQLLESSGDTSLLAWTGQSGSFNSCLPASMTVFSRRPTTHVPWVIRQAEMDVIAARLENPSVDLSTMQLYDRLQVLPVPSFSGRRMKLPCITFKLGPLTTLWDSGASEYVFRAQTTALGTVEIRTKESLSRWGCLYLVHPWIDFLLDRQPVGSVTPEETGEGGGSPCSSAAQGAGPNCDAPSSSAVPPMNSREARALQLVLRLTTPFGALLLTPDLGNVAAYSRVAADSLITVRVEPRALDGLVESVSVLDVL